MHALRTRTGVLIVGGLLAAVLFLSVPGAELWRKVLQDAAHGPVFAVVAVVLALMRPPRGLQAARPVPVLCQSGAIAVLCGAAAEVIQHFMPDRSMSLLDVLHDAAGATFGLALMYLVERGVRPVRATATVRRRPFVRGLCWVHRVDGWPRRSQAETMPSVLRLAGTKHPVAWSRSDRQCCRQSQP